MPQGCTFGLLLLFLTYFAIGCAELDVSCVPLAEKILQVTVDKCLRVVLLSSGLLMTFSRACQKVGVVRVQFMDQHCCMFCLDLFL